MLLSHLLSVGQFAELAPESASKFTWFVIAYDNEHYANNLPFISLRFKGTIARLVHPDQLRGHTALTFGLIELGYAELKLSPEMREMIQSRRRSSSETILCVKIGEIL